MAVRVDIDWRADLPELTGRVVVLREPVGADAPALAALLSLADASRFGIDEGGDAIDRFIVRAHQQRQSGAALTCVVVDRRAGVVLGLLQVKRLDPAFEGAECDCTLVPAARGTGVFADVAALVESFAFEIAGAHRLEARTLAANARANAALRKIGAVQEGVLRRAVWRDAAYADQVLWSMLADDWADSRRRQSPRGQ